MKISFRQRIFTLLLIATTALFAGEAVYTALSEPQASLWMVPFHIGVGAPLALVTAAIATVCIDQWRTQLGERWSNRKISSWLITSGLSLGLWTVATSQTAAAMTEAIVTPEYAAWATALAAGVWLLLTVFVAGPVAAIIERLLAWAAGIEAIAWSEHPLTWVGLAAVGAIAVIAAGFAIAEDTFRLLPWAFVIGPATAIGAGLGAYFLLPRFESHLRTIQRALLTGLIGFGIVTLFLPMALEDARQSFVDRPNIASLWKSTIHPVLDFDDDGHLFFYAGGDCAPFDPERGPHKTEIPNDGIDWNCSGTDLTVDLDDFHRGPPEVQRPDGIVERPHIILITTDALSHPHTSVADYKRDVTPNLAAWAKRATVFETAFANSTSTRLAMPGLLASKMNSQMHLKDARRHPYPYADHEETIGTVLDDAGYRTVHIPGTAYFERWGGYWNGFQEVDLEAYAGAADDVHTSPEITDAAVDIVVNHDDNTPLHLWIHYFDHHGPYEIPEGGKKFGDGESNQDRFDSELHFADSNWVRLLDAIESRWDPDEYIIVFTSDHGEAFDDNHPRQHHDFSVYTRPLHVPLIIQAPWGRGERIDGLTGHIDVLPTIANLVDTAPSDGWDDRLGESLIPSMVDGSPPAKSVIYSLFYIPEAVRTDEELFQMIGVRTDEWYYYDNRRRGERRLVRWREDPLDRNSFRDQKPDKFEAYRYVAQKKIEWLEERQIGLTHLLDEDDDE